MKRSAILFGIVTAGCLSAQAQTTLQASDGATITVMENARIYVNGDMVMEQNSSLTNKGTIVLEKKNGSANFTDNNKQAYNYGPGKFIFTGNGTQSISSRSRFGIIEVDDKGLNLLTNTNASQWVLKNGVVNTGGFTAIASGTDAAAVVNDAENKNYYNSWFNGNLRRYIDPGQVDQYLFPVGDDRRVKYCVLDNLTSEPISGVQYVDASFARPASLTTDARLSENGLQYTGVNRNGMWTLAPDAQPASGKFNLRVSLADFSGLNDNRFALLNQAGGSWLVPQGSLLPAEGADGRTVISGYAQRNKLSNFSQYAVAMMTAPEKDNAVSVKVFPDPVTNYEFFVQLTNCQLKELKLYTTEGNQVTVSSVVQKNEQVRVSLPPSFAKGAYTVQLFTDKGLRTAKIIVL